MRRDGHEPGSGDSVQGKVGLHLDEVVSELLMRCRNGGRDSREIGESARLLSRRHRCLSLVRRSARQSVRLQSQQACCSRNGVGPLSILQCLDARDRFKRWPHCSYVISCSAVRTEEAPACTFELCPVRDGGERAGKSLLR